YRRQTGDWPRSLPDLVPNYLSAVPLDPFDAAQLRYRLTAEGAVIYSVGRDGRDDGGNTEPLPDDHFPRDVVFTLWNLDRRRRLPRLEFPTKSGRAVKGFSVRTRLGIRTPTTSGGAHCCRRPRCIRRSPRGLRPVWRSRHRGSAPSSVRQRSSPWEHYPS